MSNRDVPGAVRRRLRRTSTRALAGGAVVLVVAVGFLAFAPGQYRRAVLSPGYAQATLQAAAPLVLAGVGGLYAEKSGVINIGIEGLLIVAAFTAVAVPALTVGVVGETAALWLGFGAAVAASTLLALVFGVVCIEFRADQIIAGLAVWLLALGIGPFGAKVLFGSVTGGANVLFSRWAVPVLSGLPLGIGKVFFESYPTTYLMFVVVPVAWYVLERTPYGAWIKASGEHPEALDTAGVDVRRVRYAGVTVSGVLSGAAGAALPLTSTGIFIGTGATMVNGRGFIAIVTYLMGNYNPLGTFVAGALFAGMDALQVRFQLVGLSVPTDLVNIVPHVTVLVVLVFFGYTRIPARAGEHYDPGE